MVFGHSRSKNASGHHLNVSRTHRSVFLSTCTCAAVCPWFGSAAFARDISLQPAAVDPNAAAQSAVAQPTAAQQPVTISIVRDTVLH